MYLLQGVGGGGGAVRVVVHDHEVDVLPHDRQYRLVPVCAVTGGDGAVGPAVAGQREHRPDLDRGIDRLHVLHDVVRVGGGALAGVVVELPVGAVVAVAVDLVADLPVLVVVALGDVGVLDPSGRLLRRPGAVVRDQDGLRSGGLNRAHE